uniref:Heat shock protein 70 n=1 Tax=Panagrolaimus sp. JU765 TaxID=591449 RepID=A0AC34QK53_9BILA
MSEFGPQFQNVEFLVTKEELNKILKKRVVGQYEKLFTMWMEYNDFDVVFLAGGTNKIPILQEIVKKKFPKAKIIIDGQIEIITATGAAIHGVQILNGEIEPFSNFERFRAVEQESTATMTKSERHVVTRSFSIIDICNL